MKMGRISRIYGAILGLCLAWGLFFSLASAQAQSLVLTVNGDPITNVDVDYQMKMLRILRQPSTREAAIESLISDRLKLQQAKKFSMVGGSADLQAEFAYAAQAAKVPIQTVVQEMQHSGIPQQQLKDHWEAEATFRYFVKALNRGVEPSDDEIRQAVAEKGVGTAGVSFTLQEVIVVVAGNDLPQRFKEAEQLRARFTDCTTAATVTGGFQNVVLKPSFVRTSSGMNEPMRKLLDSTPVGHLTQPSRTAEGISMVAVCERKSANDISEQRDAVKDYALDKKLAPLMKSSYQELRDRAVIIKR